MSPNTRPRGLLALLNEEVKTFFPYDPDLIQQSTPQLFKRHGRAQIVKQENALDTSPNDDDDLTLFFFADTTCKNSIRFRSILAEFLQSLCKNDDAGVVSCVTILNSERNEDLFCNGTGFYKLPWHYENRTALIKLLSISHVPTVVVVRNKTGQKVTDLGMRAIECNRKSNGKHLVEQWRQNKSGLTILQRIGCVIT